MSEQMGFGFVDDKAEDLQGQGKARGVFGLNTGNITVFQFVNQSKDGNPLEAIDITFKVKDAEYRRRLFNITKVYLEGNEIDASHEKYNELFNKEMRQLQAVVTHVLGALGVTKEIIQKALAVPPTTFEQWAKIMTSLVGDGFETRPVDGFLEYEWTIGAKNDKTYLQLPKNMKGGAFLCASVAKTEPWVAVTLEDGTLVYKSGVIEHPFTKSGNFMESHKAIQQFIGGAKTTPSAIGGPEAATAASWGAVD